ncbi:hypothetical protein ADL35_32635 [Streptomyces sp. NRRL WC-3753]|nr:hypothetical protein ADL35_32635 [Streptomyces sp. NRRL WC-3753]
MVQADVVRVSEGAGSGRVEEGGVEQCDLAAARGDVGVAGAAVRGGQEVGVGGASVRAVSGDQLLVADQAAVPSVLVVLDDGCRVRSGERGEVVEVERVQSGRERPTSSMS